MDDQRSHAQRLRDQGRDIRREAGLLVGTVEGAAGEVESILREQMARRPYVALATAAGVGYVCGGGLASRLTKFLLGVGARLAVAMAARELSILLRSDHPRMGAHAAEGFTHERRSNHDD